MKKMTIWNQDLSQENHGFYFERDATRRVVDLSQNYVIKISGLSVSEVDKLNVTAKDLDEKIDNEDELAEFLKTQGYEAFELCSLGDYVSTEPALCFDMNESSFFDLDMCETEQKYSWWDGHNWKDLFCDSSIDVDVSDESVDLDEWDGNNMVTGGIGAHQSIGRVVELNGYPVAEPTYIVIFESQWEGEHTSAKVVNEDEIREHLEEINRDVDEYMEKIQTL